MDLAEKNLFLPERRSDEVVGAFPLRNVARVRNDGFPLLHVEELHAHFHWYSRPILRPVRALADRASFGPEPGESRGHRSLALLLEYVGRTEPKNLLACVSELIAGDVIDFNDLFREPFRPDGAEHEYRLAAVVEEKAESGLTHPSPGGTLRYRRGHELDSGGGQNEYDRYIKNRQEISVAAVDIDDFPAYFKNSHDSRNKDNEGRHHDIRLPRKREGGKDEYAGECQQCRVMRPF